MTMLQRCDFHSQASLSRVSNEDQMYSSVLRPIRAMCEKPFYLGFSVSPLPTLNSWDMDLTDVYVQK